MIKARKCIYCKRKILAFQWSNINRLMCDWCDEIINEQLTNRDKQISVEALKKAGVIK